MNTKQTHRSLSNRAPSRPTRLLSALLLAAGLGACADTSGPGQISQEADGLRPTPAAGSVAAGEAFFRVYTRNVYLGGDTGPLFTLDFTDTSPQGMAAILGAVNTFWNSVQATRFQERAEAIADEIALTDPHVVGLQEVASYGEVDLSSGAPVVVDGLDMVATLQAALAARGLDYALVVKQDNTSSQLPLAVGATGITRVLTFTTGEATLVRGDVTVTDHAQGRYAAALNLGPVEIGRGWSRVTTTFRGATHHVVNTHLETQGIRPIHDAQAQELLGSVLAGLEGVTILMGDLNSDAAAGPGAPSWTPTYGLLTGAGGAGFVDAWTEAVARSDEGFTCCHAPDLQNPFPTLDERIDFVLVRAPEAAPGDEDLLSGAIRMMVLGDETGDQTATSGLWPADHAALLAGVNLPRGLVTEQ